MACGSQLSKRAVPGVALSPLLQPVRSLRIFTFASLGRVDKVQEQLVWGSAQVYPDASAPAFQRRGSLRGAGRSAGAGGLPGRKSPPLINFRIVHACSKCPDRVFTCVIGVFFFFNYFIYFGCVGSLLRCAGFSLRWLLLLWSAGSRAQASVVVAPGLSCSAACGIFPDQGSNPCALPWQADSQPLRPQGSPLAGS